MSQKQKILIAIAGPTAIGKTALAIEVARYFNTEIISADSRQFFKEMSIGTAKPNPQELAQAKHHFIDSHSIKDDFSVGNFEKQAIACLGKIFENHDVTVMVGGSGLYVNAVLYGFDELPKASDALRAQLNERLKTEGIELLQEELKNLDPDYYAEVDVYNPQRIIRALEVCLSTGKTFSSFRNKQHKERDFDIILIGLNTDRELLYSRINQRVDLMIKDGLVEEVRALQAYQHLNALKTVGYSEIFRHLNKEWTLSEAIEKLKQNTRNFAKRQITWFKKNEGIIWFEPTETQQIIDFIKEKLITTTK
ncbi:tRNA (adenosine(37)-N6)-dimethylallyltransferase MiaA [Pedobacter arcticus]|uniref:tRNA (adenosine(37)-N6)-dimethylallyltransferase MiaA n=1 Tax=Pedobacter arcticus TaxID=752140 RepID=UPI0002F899DE|nr:tRNA (adenosine(37)-N6)-dimethylallyltransferase MiaA [Pedobacter arcticus]